MKRRNRRPFACQPVEALESRMLLTTFEVSPGESVQAAISSAGNGDTIQINEGTYNEQLLVQDKSLKLVGVGDVTLSGQNLNSAIGLKAKGGKSISVSNIAFTKFSLALDAEEVSKVSLMDIGATDNGLGVYISSAKKLTVSGLTSMSNGPVGLAITDVRSVTVKDSVISENEFSGIDLNRVGKAKLDTVTANFNEWDGLEVSQTGSVLVTNSDFSFNGEADNGRNHGIDITSTKTVKLKNTTAELNAASGLAVSQSELFGKVVVLDSVFSSNGHNGMDFDQVKTVVVSRSTANGNDIDGMDVDSGGKITVKTSEFAGNHDDGIDIFDTVFKQSKVDAFSNADQDIELT